MKITSRTLVILGATVFILILSLFLIADLFIQSTYTDMELKQSDSNIQLVMDQIRYDADQLGTKARDWAVWDDTYRFMDDCNQHYRESVILSPTTYETLQVSGIIYFDNDGNTVASQGFDLKSRSQVNLSADVVATLSDTLGLLSNTRGGKKKQGLVMLPDGPVLVGMHTILQTNGGGSGHGTLVMLQPFDEAKVAAIQSHLHLPVRVWQWGDPSLAGYPGISQLSGQDPPASVSLIQGPSVISEFSLVNDIENQPILILEVRTPRTVSQHAVSSLVYLIIAFLVIGIIYVFFTGYLLRRYVISPLTDLDAGMKRIGEKRDLSERLPVEGDDEITSLTMSFNTMLQELQDKETDLATKAELLAEEHRKANMYLDIYLDVLTYEIRNITISLQAYAELIRESEDEASKEYADRITVALNRNLSIIRNMEIISRIYKTPPVLVPVNLETIVKRVIRKFPGENIRYSGCEVMVIADETLSTVFYNIIQNSLQYGDPGVQIDISVRDIDENTWEVSVVDNGKGISYEMKPLVFDRFMKGSDKRSSYGLGLHIVRLLVDAYGGTVRADDRISGHPEQGAAIRFTLKKRLI